MRERRLSLRAAPGGHRARDHQRRAVLDALKCTRGGGCRAAPTLNCSKVVLRADRHAHASCLSPSPRAKALYGARFRPPRAEHRWASLQPYPGCISRRAETVRSSAEPGQKALRRARQRRVGAGQRARAENARRTARDRRGAHRYVTGVRTQ